MRRARWCLVAVAVLVVAAGCGFSGKKAVADRIRTSPDRLRDDGSALAIELQTRMRPIGRLAVGQGGSTPPAPGLRTQGSLHYAARQAALAVSLASGPEAFQVMDGTDLYQRRLGGAPSQRPWLRLDLVDLYPDRQAQDGIGVGTQLVTPVMVVDILRGTLSGSVRDDGAESIGATPTTRYRMNVDLEKAFDGASEPVRRSFDAVRTLIGIKKVVQPGRVWLDERGAIRRVELRLAEERSRDEGVEVTLVLDLLAGALPAPITLPPAEQIAAVEDIQSLVAAVRPPGSDR